MTETMTVIYNADCPICAREIAHYRRLTERHDLPVRYAGLDAPDVIDSGLTRDDAARRLHVVRDGEVIAGVPAFIALWRVIPGFRWAARIVSLPGLRQIATHSYDWVLAPALYALHRRRVRRKAACG